MTHITITDKYIKVKGHSGYETFGKDIVCAAISILVESTYHYLAATENTVRKQEDDALFIIKTQNLNKSGRQIVQSFKGIVNDLEKQYSNFIKVEDRRD